MTEPESPHKHALPSCFLFSNSKANDKNLTAKDGCSQILHTGDGGGQAGDNAHDPVKEGGVGGHGQDGGLTAVHLLALHHHSEAHAEVVRPPQGGHHSPTHEPGDDENIFRDYGKMNAYLKRHCFVSHGDQPC